MDLSNFTEDDITCAWLLLKSRIIKPGIRISKTSVENFQYPLNVIVKMAVIYDIHIDNAKYIKEYNDVYNTMEEVLSITEIEQIKPSHLKAFQKFNKERGVRQKTLNMYISSF